MFFHDDPDHVADTKQVILQVKGRKAGAKDVRDLRTFKKAPKVKKRDAGQGEIFD